MSTQPTIESAIEKIRNSIILKVAIIGALMLILLIPASMVESLIRERQDRKLGAVNEISSKWGSSQTITGPIITIPYKTFTQTTITDKKGKTHTKTHTTINHLYILPETLKITGEISPEIRYRGIYKAVLYSADMQLKGSFPDVRKKVKEIAGEDIMWDKAILSIGVTDLRGIRESVAIKINDKEVPIAAGAGLHDFTSSGLNGKLIDLENAQQTDFDINLSINGSQQISFIPVGKSTELDLTSTWNSPSFDGAYLPIERKINNQGFSAKWRIFEFNRNYPQMWKNAKFNYNGSAFGVRLFIGNDIYQQSTRTVKYAELFIVFTFTAIFLSEVLSKTKVHSFQYLMTGLAVTIFYVLLISISEHLDFAKAYLLSAIAIVLLIFSYIKCIFKKFLMPVIIAIIQIILYVYFYVTLKSEDYALLMGSLGLFTVLAVVMYVTRKINWDKLNYSSHEQQP